MYRSHVLFSAVAGVGAVTAGGGAPAAAGNPTETTTAANVPAATPAAAKPRAKRGEGAKRFGSLADAQAGKVDKAHVFSAKMGDGPEKFYTASHRATVMGAILSDYGIKVKDHDVQERADANPQATADSALSKLSDDERQALFAKYMSGGNFTAAAGLPAAAGKRDDTAAGFDAGNNGGKPATATAQRTTAAAATGKAGSGKGGK